METLKGTVERVTFRNPESGFAVVKLRPQGMSELVCAIGVMPPLQPGETIECRGTWQFHRDHGRQFITEQCVIRAPSDVVGIEKYLGSGLIDGIGPVLSQRIVAHFGIDTLDILERAPQRLREIPGLGTKRIHQITSGWEAQRTVRDVMIFLQSFGVTPAYAQRIYKTYGSHSVIRLREDPYRLARDVSGIGFRKADAIAFKMGIDRDSPKRLAAGVLFVLSELADLGHVCFPLQDFLERAQAVLEVEAGRIVSALEEPCARERLVIREAKGCFHVWLKPLCLAEEGIVREVQRLLSGGCRLRKVDALRAIEWAQRKLHLALSAQQHEGVRRALKEKLLIITGGPGTGKSTIINAILTITRQLTSSIILAAPTGRAAKRMEEITKRSAKTIHSLLEWDFKAGTFKRGSSDPLSCDLLIVDEASMIDTRLMHSLLKAVPDHARVVFVGDVNQLPSVGPGNVLSDMIASLVLPCVTLDQIYRQAAGSQIILNAHRIHRGEMPEMAGGFRSDFFFVKEEDPVKLRELIVDLVKTRLPRRYSFDPINDIQVLTPMKRGPVGSEQLNAALQEALNASQVGLSTFGRRYLLGDKVMQMRNNYSKEVFNGDVGVVASLDAEGERLSVTFDGREVAYDQMEMEELALAYAVSVHKGQGSEYPCVVIPVHTTHYKLLFRNLLYTAVTRGKRLVVLAGTWKALSIAVGNVDSMERHTTLREQLALSGRSSSD